MSRPTRNENPGQDAILAGVESVHERTRGRTDDTAKVQPRATFARRNQPRPKDSREASRYENSVAGTDRQGNVHHGSRVRNPHPAIYGASNTSRRSHSSDRSEFTQPRRSPAGDGPAPRRASTQTYGESSSRFVAVLPTATKRARSASYLESRAPASIDRARFVCNGTAGGAADNDQYIARVDGTFWRVVWQITDARTSSARLQAAGLGLPRFAARRHPEC